MISDPVHALVAVDAGVDRAVVEALLTAEPLRVLEYVDIENGGVLDAGDVLVVACASYTDEVGEYLRAASERRPGRPVVLVAPARSNGFVSEAFGAGADEILAMPAHSSPEQARTLSRQLAFTVEKAVARKNGAPAAKAQLGAMICVLGLKGGAGKTLTASNLAVSLADAGRRVTIVDLDLQFGDVGLAIGLTPTKTIYDLLSAGGSLDAGKLEDFLIVHPSGLRALLAPSRPDQAGAITAEFLQEVFALLREMNEFVVVDTPPSFSPQVIAAVDSASDLCMVAMLDSLSLKNAKLGLETLQRMDCDVSQIRLVLNRADSNVGIGREDVAAIMGGEPDVLVPSDRNVTRSINHGEPIVLERRRSDAAKAFRRLAELYIEDARAKDGVPAPTRKRRRLLRRGR